LQVQSSGRKLALLAGAVALPSNRARELERAERLIENANNVRSTTYVADANTPEPALLYTAPSDGQEVVTVVAGLCPLLSSVKWPTAVEWRLGRSEATGYPVDESIPELKIAFAGKTNLASARAPLRSLALTAALCIIVLTTGVSFFLVQRDTARAEELARLRSAVSIT
jgi:hypothetical protein